MEERLVKKWLKNGESPVMTMNLMKRMAKGLSFNVTEDTLMLSLMKLAEKVNFHILPAVTGI